MPGEFRGCGDQISRPPETPPYSESLRTGSGNRGSLHGVLHGPLGGDHFGPGIRLCDGASRQGEQIQRPQGTEQPQAPVPAGVRGVEALGTLL